MIYLCNSSTVGRRRLDSSRLFPCESAMDQAQCMVYSCKDACRSNLLWSIETRVVSALLEASFPRTLLQTAKQFTRTNSRRDRSVLHRWRSTATQWLHRISYQKANWWCDCNASANPIPRQAPELFLLRALQESTKFLHWRWTWSVY